MVGDPKSGQKRDRGIKMLEVVKGYFSKKNYEILVGIELQLSLHRIIRRKRGEGEVWLPITLSCFMHYLE